jgi:hypothetical protein
VRAAGLSEQPAELSSLAASLHNSIHAKLLPVRIDKRGRILGGKKGLSNLITEALIRFEEVGSLPTMNVDLARLADLKRRKERMSKSASNRRRLESEREVQTLERDLVRIERGASTLLDKLRTLEPDPDRIAEALSEYLERWLGLHKRQGISLDVFREDILGSTISVQVHLGEREEKELLESMRQEAWALRIPWMCSEFPQEIMITKVIPAIIYETVRADADQNPEIDNNQLYEFYSWRFGLA